MAGILPYRGLMSDESSEESSTLKSILIQVSLNALLFMLIFGMSATINISSIKQQLRNCAAITTGVLMQFVIMPLLGFAAVISLKPYGLTTPMGITLLIVTSSPGGSYSNWWCSLFNADLALSVAMTGLSTLISIAALPLNLLLYSHFAYGYDRQQERHVLASVDFPKLLISLGVVISGIILGVFASFKVDSSKFQRLANAGGSIAGILLIVISAIFSTRGTSDAKPWNQHWSFYIGVGLPCVVGLILANAIAKFARLKKPEIVTLSVECSYQNTGIATTAVVAMFNDPEKVAQAMAVPLFYGVVEMGLLGLYCLAAWKLGWTKAPSEEKICVVMTKTYEVLDSDEEDDITALQNSVDNNIAKDKKKKVRDRLDTLESDGTVTLSFSDVGSYDGPTHSTNHTSSERLKHTRSFPQRSGYNNDIQIPKVFQTIKEETEHVVEVAEHQLRKDEDDVKEKNSESAVSSFLSFEGDTQGRRTGDDSRFL